MFQVIESYSINQNPKKITLTLKDNPTPRIINHQDDGEFNLISSLLNNHSHRILKWQEQPKLINASTISLNNNYVKNYTLNYITTENVSTPNRFGMYITATDDVAYPVLVVENNELMFLAMSQVLSQM